MLNIERKNDHNFLGKQKKKKQIILCHTSREVSDYLTSLGLRINNKYFKVPNFVIDRKGTILQLIPESAYSNFFDSINVNRNSIIIVLENLGWLEKKQLSNEYINWNGNIYNGKVYEKKWRDYSFWQPYTEEQIKSTVDICSYIIEKHKIKRNLIGHNTKVGGIENYEGIVTRSNFDTKFTDLNPSFDFEKFKKYIDDGKYT